MEAPPEKPKRKRKPKEETNGIPLYQLAGLITLLIVVLVFAGQSMFSGRSTTVVSVEGDSPRQDAVPLDDSVVTSSSFEIDPTTIGWTFDARGTDAVTEWTDDEARSGTHAIKLVAGTGANQGWPGWFNTQPIISEMSYTFSAQAYSPDGASAWLAIDLLNEDGGLVRGYSTGCAQSESDWHRKEVTITPEQYADTGAVQMRLGLLQCLNFSEGETTTLYFDDVSLIP